MDLLEASRGATVLRDSASGVLSCSKPVLNLGRISAKLFRVITKSIRNETC